MDILSARRTFHKIFEANAYNSSNIVYVSAKLQDCLSYIGDSGVCIGYHQRQLYCAPILVNV